MELTNDEVDVKIADLTKEQDRVAEEIKFHQAQILRCNASLTDLCCRIALLRNYKIERQGL